MLLLRREGEEMSPKKADGDVPEKENGLGYSSATKDLLELKDTSELMVDLSYSALLYDSEDIANEIIYLEEVADALEKRVVVSALNEVAQHSDSAKGYVLIRLAQAMEMIADAAVSMADVILRDIEKNPVMRLSLRDSRTTITSVKLAKRCALDGKSLGQARLATESGMWVIAVRRDKSYIYGPDENTVVKAGDTLIARGSRKGVPMLFRMAGWTPKGGSEDMGLEEDAE